MSLSQLYLDLARFSFLVLWAIVALALGSSDVCPHASSSGKAAELDAAIVSLVSHELVVILKVGYKASVELSLGLGWPVQLTRMAGVKELSELGKSFGFEGSELLEFIKREREYQKEQQQEKERREKELWQHEADERKEREKLARDERAHQLEMRRQEKEILELQVKVETGKAEGLGHTGNNDNAPVKARAPKLPFFEDTKDDIDSYLKRFERYASSQGWDHDHWAINLSALLKGRALEVYSRIAPYDADDYEVLKSALLKRYRLTQEGFRLKFRSARPEDGETAPQFVVRLDNLFTRWVDLAKVEKTYNGIRDLLIREQFINASSKELALFIKERQPKDVNELAVLAEKFQEARGTGYLSTLSGSKRPQHSQSSWKRPGAEQKTTNVGKDHAGTSTRPLCFFCDKPGHVARDCRKRMQAQSKFMKTAGMKFAAGRKHQSSNPKQSRPSEKHTESSQRQECTRCNCESCSKPVGQSSRTQDQSPVKTVGLSCGRSRFRRVLR